MAGKKKNCLNRCCAQDLIHDPAGPSIAERTFICSRLRLVDLR